MCLSCAAVNDLKYFLPTRFNCVIVNDLKYFLLTRFNCVIAIDLKGFSSHQLGTIHQSVSHGVQFTALTCIEDIRHAQSVSRPASYISWSCRRSIAINRHGL